MKTSIVKECEYAKKKKKEKKDKCPLNRPQLAYSDIYIKRLMKIEKGDSNLLTKVKCS